jgi:hypothetical protein
MDLKKLLGAIKRSLLCIKKTVEEVEDLDLDLDLDVFTSQRK